MPHVSFCRWRTTLAGCLGLSGLLTLPSPLHAAPTVVTLGFDDTLGNQFVAAPILARHGAHAVFYVNSHFVDTGGHMTEAQLRSLEQDGNEIASHTQDHLDLPTLSATDQAQQICDDRYWLVHHGFRVTSFAYPWGDFNADVQKLVDACGFNSARTVGGIVSPTDCFDCATAENIPPHNLYQMETPDPVEDTTTLAQLEQFVTQAEDNGGGWVQLLMHNVCDGCGRYAISPQLLSDFLDWLVLRGRAGTVIKTVDEVIGGPFKPAIASKELANRMVPNLLANPSLEDVDPFGVPQCWERDQWGSSVYDWSRSNDAHEGNLSQMLDVSQRTSGDIKLLVRRDAACLPAVQSGHTYVVGSWYHGSAPTGFVAFYEDGGGNWVYWTESDDLPPNQGWTQATWTLPPLPVGAQALTVGMVAWSPGTLWMDDFSLIDSTQ